MLLGPCCLVFEATDEGSSGHVCRLGLPPQKLAHFLIKFTSGVLDSTARSVGVVAAHATIGADA
jgi:hypothetical protein